MFKVHWNELEKLEKIWMININDINEINDNKPENGKMKTFCNTDSSGSIAIIKYFMTINLIDLRHHKKVLSLLPI